uniref:Dro6 protein n=2 Tax=Drosophila melanogaster TaxID=7227 RepID=Q9VZQ4_DROME|eukprot:NP_728873.1 Drosomycin-like 6 [Drosophila melanogaster]
MMQIKFLFTFLALLMMVILGAKEADADCLSGRYRGPCAVWDNETCRRVCREEGRGRVSGHCSARLQCWCEGC